MRQTLSLPAPTARKALEALSPDARRARDLARMRWAATGLLVLLAVVFVAASLLQRRWPALAFVRAFSEAGMVGACADWFAVTALFRHPFGIPIPHTGIIPRNKDRIGAALGGFIAENFLTEAVLRAKLRNLEVGRWGGAWMSDPANARSFADRLAGVAPRLVGAAPKGLVGSLAGSALLAAMRAMPAAPAAAHLLQWLWRNGDGEALVDRGLASASAYVSANKKNLGRQFARRSSGWLSSWLDGLLAPQVIDGLVRLLDEMQARDHRFRRILRVIVRRWIRRLRTDPELQHKIEETKRDLLSHPALLAQLQAVEAVLEARLARDIVSDQRALAERLEKAFVALGGWLANDDRTQDLLNAWAAELVTGVIGPRRQDIGRFVAEVVAGWDTRSVTEKLELQVGKDLQYIRINGALVGGLVGLIIFTLARVTGLG
jgi:uncharacterized membrane-anchored protein YjiN (DUF445 family)